MELDQKYGALQHCLHFPQQHPAAAMCDFLKRAAGQAVQEDDAVHYVPAVLRLVRSCRRFRIQLVQLR
ncbi:hypothetical protein D3C84_894850 [compost metagenome]